MIVSLSSRVAADRGVLSEAHSPRLPTPVPGSNSAEEPMRIEPAIVGMGGRSAALVWRLARDFMRRHVRRILFAFLLMGLAAASTAGRAWLMEPVLDRIFVARGGLLVLLVAGGALALALVKGLADYGQGGGVTR